MDKVRGKWLIVFLLCTLCIFAAKPQRKGTGRKVKGDNRVYLLNADRLHYDMWKNRDAQILNGNVRFRHQGATLNCDSAYFFEQTNSFEAFGHVKMVQGDTLTLVSEYAYYDGNDQMAMARHNVVLTHRKSKLYTDSLNFDRLYNVGYFFDGGKLVDKKNTLTSDWGEYNTETREAIFNYDVKLKNDDYYITSDTLHYDTRTETAHLVGPSNIISGESHIYSETGYYNTNTDFSQLYDRSVVTREGKRIVGDTLYYDSKSKVSEGFGNVIYTDSINKSQFVSDYGYYDELKGEGVAYGNAKAVDFSQKDTLYVHADTFRIHTFNIETDSVYRRVHGYKHVRAYRIDLQAACDSMMFCSLDSCLRLYQDPVVWNDNQQLLGEEIRVYMNDSTIDWAHVIGQALSVQLHRDGEHYNQISSKEMRAFFENGDMRNSEAETNVCIIFYPEDESDSTLIGLNYTETDKMRMTMHNKKLERIWMPAAEGTLYPMNQIPSNRLYLPSFVWLDYMRPQDKDDIFVWIPKKDEHKLKAETPKERPQSKFSRSAKPTTNQVQPMTKEGGTNE